MRIVIAGVIALAVALVAVPSAEARTYCGKVTMHYSYGDFDFKTYRIRGKITCRSVRRVLRQSIPLSDVARGWECIKLHTPPPYDVTCGAPEGAEDFARRVGAIRAE